MSTLRVLGTAGHVDHGKTALVRALTGYETDRLDEERRRGISIELGFAPLHIGDRRISLIDVPGHERFVRHMVAGASGIDGFLLCVAADDGVMPQTREHLDVLSLLGVDGGVVAITMSDRADPARAMGQMRALVAPGTEIVAVSSTTGEGVSELRDALGRLVERIGRRTVSGSPRLHIDRTFVAPGAGTVVTGTLWGDPLVVDDRVTIHPGGHTGRIRGMQVHDEAVDSADGGRVALNLAGIDRRAAPRGAVVVRSGDDWRPSSLLDVDLMLLDSAQRPLVTRRRLQAFLGTTEVPVTCVLLEGDEIAPGTKGFVQLRLERPVLARAGDRLVLRSAEPRTVAGAVVIDPVPARHGRGGGAADRLRTLRSGDARAIAAMLLREAGTTGLPFDHPRAADVDPADGRRIDGRWYADEVVEGAREVMAAARSEGDAGVGSLASRTGLPPGVVRELAGETDGAPSPPLSGDAERVRAMIRAAERRPPAPPVISDQLGLTGDEVIGLLRELAHAGRVVRAGELWFDADVLRAAEAEAHAALAERDLGVGELRDLWGVGRRQAIALAAHLDAIGMTLRDGDRRRLRPSYRPSP